MPDREMKEYIIKMRPCMVFGHTQEIVRCKDCKHFAPDGVYTMCYRHNGLSQGTDWYCADGERRESE